MNDILAMKEEYENKMTKEFDSFIDAYNSVAPSRVPQFSELKRKYGYQMIVRMLGKYMLTFDSKTWSGSIMNFGHCDIHFYVFVGTHWYQSVENFLLSLERAFRIDIGPDVAKYFLECKMCEESKDCCMRYFIAFDNLNKSIARNTFENLFFDPSSKDDVDTYIKHEIHAVHDIIQEIQAKPDLVKDVESFLSDLKQISMKKDKGSVKFVVPPEL